MLAAGASFALMSVFVKIGSASFSSHEMVFWRSALGLVFLYVFLRLPHGAAMPRAVATPHLGMQLRRGLVGFIALTAFFYSLAKLPMSVAVTLNYTSPLFLALLMPWWLHERPRPAQYLAVALGFLGVLLLLRPWQGGGDTVAGLIGLFSGLMAALAYGHVRQLGKLGEPEWRTVFWFAVVGMVGAGLASSLTGWHLPGVEHVGLILALGIFATFGQLAMTRAYRTGRTEVVAALAYSTVVFSSLLDGLIWKQGLPVIAWAGIAITMAAGVWAVRLNQQEPS
jgi:drug/metabolite transporter (DMT)-like permease